MFRLAKVVCPECGAWFARRDGFVRHMHSFHEGPRIVCAMCGQTFSRRDHLLRHHRTIHVRREPYPPPPPSSPPSHYFCNKPDPASPPFQNSPPSSPQFPPATPASPTEVKEPSYEDGDVTVHGPDVPELPQTVREYRPDLDGKGRHSAPEEIRPEIQHQQPEPDLEVMADNEVAFIMGRSHSTPSNTRGLSPVFIAAVTDPAEDTDYESDVTVESFSPSPVPPVADPVEYVCFGCENRCFFTLAHLVSHERRHHPHDPLLPPPSGGGPTPGSPRRVVIAETLPHG